MGVTNDVVIVAAARCWWCCAMLLEMAAALLFGRDQSVLQQLPFANHCQYIGSFLAFWGVATIAEWWGSPPPPLAAYIAIATAIVRWNARRKSSEANAPWLRPRQPRKKVNNHNVKCIELQPIVSNYSKWVSRRLMSNHGTMITFKLKWMAAFRSAV